MKLDPKFSAAIQEIETSRGIPRDRILGALREGVHAAYEKSHGTTTNLEVDINLPTGSIEAYLSMRVVEEVLDPREEIDLDRRARDRRSGGPRR